MTFDDYLRSINNDRLSAELSETLRSLWWDKKGDWDAGHAIAQEIPTA
ncbi:MAG: hypothetical protein JSV31_08010 [Desulfobacterales bacterium]|nr:MAG: hypothetical protein JSV31_08010 [Desulfobacterales bacterium]